MNEQCERRLGENKKKMIEWVDRGSQETERKEKNIYIYIAREIVLQLPELLTKSQYVCKIL